MTACAACRGEGVVTVAGTSINPYTGVRGRDPQEDRDETCADCGGTGSHDQLTLDEELGDWHQWVLSLPNQGDEG